MFQINFFKDHTKIILCPLMGAVTYIDDQRNHRTFSFELIEKHGKTLMIYSLNHSVLTKMHLTGFSFMPKINSI